MDVVNIFDTPVFVSKMVAQFDTFRETITPRQQEILDDIVFYDAEFFQVMLKDGVLCIPYSVGMFKADGSRLYLSLDHMTDASEHGALNTDNPYAEKNKQQYTWNMDNMVIDSVRRPDMLTSPAVSSPDEMRQQVIDFCGERPIFWAKTGAGDDIALKHILGGFSNKPKTWPHNYMDLGVLYQYLDESITKDGALLEKAKVPSVGPEHNPLADAIQVALCWLSIFKLYNAPSILFNRPR